MRWWSGWAREEGSALVAAVGVMAIFTVLAVAAFTISDQALFESGREREAARALHVAEAGLDTALWRIRRVGHNIESSFTVDTGTGVATVTAEPLGTYQYRLRSRGHTNREPRIVRTLTAKVFYVSLWNFVMGTGSLAAGGGGALVGNTSVNGPFYVRGSLPLSGSSKITGGPLFVKKGDITMAGSAQIGASAQWIDVFCDGTYPKPGTKEFYANVDISTPDLQLPPLGASELLVRYSQAKQESIDGRYGTNGAGPANNEVAVPPNSPGKLPGFYKVIDSDGAPGGAETNIHFSAALPAFGTATDDFAWNPATMTLYVAGTVYVDGTVTFSGNIRYRGNGTIVASKNITINNDVLPFGHPGSYPSQDALGYVTPKTIYINTGGGNVPNPTFADAKLAGAWFAVEDMVFANNIVIRGSLLCSTLRFSGNNNHVLTDPQLPDYLPPSMPGGTDRMVFPTRWHEGLN